MKIELTNELKGICTQIAESKWSDKEWADHESDDWFQTEHYSGGYDATEQAFCFSYYDKQGVEYWFQFTLEQAYQIALSEVPSIVGRLAE